MEVYISLKNLEKCPSLQEDTKFMNLEKQLQEVTSKENIANIQPQGKWKVKIRNKSRSNNKIS